MFSVYCILNTNNKENTVPATFLAAAKSVQSYDSTTIEIFVEIISQVNAAYFLSNLLIRLQLLAWSFVILINISKPQKN